MVQSYLRQRRGVLLTFLLFGGLFAVTFALYSLPVQAVAYPFLLCAVAGSILLAADYRQALRRHRQMERVLRLPDEIAASLPPADTVEREDYRQLVALLEESRRQIQSQAQRRYGDMVDYYTLWAHQIKTPIASMRLTLQNEDSDLARSLSGDLMRVEQYVEMVLVFLRLDSSTTDYVIRRHSLDDIVRPAVRRFAGAALTGAQIVSVMDGKRDLVAELLDEARAANEAHAGEEEHHHHHHHHDEDDHDHEHCCHHDHDEDEHDHEHCCHHDHDEDDHDHEHCCHDEHDHHHEHHYDEHGVCSCGHHHDHDADEVFTSWGKETAHKYSREDLDKALHALDEGAYGMILRAKGIVDGGDTWYEFDMVPGEHEIRTCGPDVTGKLCVIGSELKEHEIAELFHV
mgnify:CR=1 FL=1